MPLGHFCCLEIKGMVCVLKAVNLEKEGKSTGVCGVLVGNANSEDASGVLCTLQHSRPQRVMGLLPYARKSHSVEISLHHLPLPPPKHVMYFALWILFTC